MGILRALDGRFYEIPDEQMAKFLIPGDKVKERLQAAGIQAQPAGGGGPPRGSQGGPPPGGYPQGAEMPGAGVEPYGWWWQNWHGPRWGPGWGWHNWGPGPRWGPWGWHNWW